jgi:hypothetical protein
MRFFLVGRKILGLRPGISFGLEDFFPNRTPVNHNRAAASSSRPFVYVIGQPFIYVIRGDQGHCKIGKTGDPTSRLSELNTASAFPLSYAFIGVVESNDASRVERAAHDLLDRYRVNGEWFNCPAELAVGAVNACGAKLGERICAINEEQAERIRASVDAQNGVARPQSKIRMAIRILILAVMAIAIFSWLRVQ